VSLLMDALRKAEQQKQGLALQNQPDRTVEPSSSLELEPITSPVAAPASGVSPTPQPDNKPGGNQLPELPSRLEDLDEQFMSHAAKTPFKPSPTIAPPPPAPVTQPRESTTEASPEAARKLFEAKHSAPGSNRNFAVAIGLVTFIAVAGIGGYFWWQLQPRSGLAATGAAPITPAAPATAQQPPPSAPVAVPPAPTFAAPAAPAPTPPGTQAAAGPSNDDDESAVQQPAPRRMETRPAPATTAAQATSPIRLSTAPQRINPLLDQAYQAFNRGEIDLARANWQQVLAADPRNSDALHGMAVIAQQYQQTGEAADYYLRALEVDPKDALALSGLVSLRTPADTQATESRLKTLLAEQPDSPHLNFALGNLYARSTRWAEAQQAYFKAHTADPGNPDLLFNLAVSLDQLHKSGLAIQYYKQALATISKQPVGFDPAQVSARLQILQADPLH